MNYCKAYLSILTKSLGEAQFGKKSHPKPSGRILGNAEGQNLIADLLVYYTGHASESDQKELLDRYRKITDNFETSLPILSKETNFKTTK